jgi:hypothetical protein
MNLSQNAALGGRSHSVQRVLILSMYIKVIGFAIIPLSSVKESSYLFKPLLPFHGR